MELKGHIKKIRQQLIIEMKNIFGNDMKRICHALSVLDNAELINTEHAADELVVIASAILHDIGIRQAEKVHNSNAGKYQEIEGPPIAKTIVKKLGLDDERCNLICRIIANHHSARDLATSKTPEFEVIWDADWIVNIPDLYPDTSPVKIKEIIDKVFRTARGRQMAISKYTDQSQ